MMRRTADAFKAAAASAALALLVVGLPVLLVAAVGWPLPRQLPHLSEIADTLTGNQPLESTTVWKILAVILWLAWLQVLAAVVIEAVSVARGSLPRLIPGLNLAHGLVAPLIATIVLAWPAGAASRASAAPPPVVPRRDPPPTTVSAPIPTPAAEPVAATSTPIATTEHTVQRRDTLWDLAERYLGDGYRAGEIFDLNRGRPQADGSSLTDPGLIRPGWILQIPSTAATEAASGGSITVRPDDTLWDIAADRLHDGHRFTEIVDLNAGRPQPDGHALTNPNLIEPGWVLELPGSATTNAATNGAPVTEPWAAPPPTPSTVPTSTPTTSVPATTTAVPHDADGVGAAAAVHADDDTDDSRPLPPLGLVGGGVATAGLIAVLERRRRAQLRRRRRGEVPPPLSADQRTTEAALRSGADPALAARINEATRAAATVNGATGLPPIERVEARQDAVSLVLDAPAPAPPGFMSASPTEWQTSERLDTVHGGPGSPAPALVAVGTSADGSEVLIDLEQPACTTIIGDSHDATRLAAAMAVAVASAPWSDHTRVLMVGRRPLPLDDLEQCASLDDALDELEARAHLVANALDVARCATLTQARAAGVTPDLWAPLVVISTAEPDARQLARAGALAGPDRQGVALVMCVSSDASIGRRIQITSDGRATIDDDLTVHAHLLDDAELHAFADVLDHADQECIAAVPAPRSTGADGTGVETGQAALDALLADLDVVVSVLGDVEAGRAVMRGERLAVTKQKSLEAVAYLALRETRVDREDLQAALWPAGANSAKTFHNTIWAARKMLAQGRDGDELFPEPFEGHYRLSDRVTTDYGLFHELTARAEEIGDPVAAADLLAAALTLVRGEPFMGVGRGYAWAAPHAGLIVAQVVDAAEELAEMRLAGGDWRGAEWAARQGLRVFPCEERLYRLLMRSAHAAGSVPGVHRAFQELAAAVADPDDGVEPDDTLHPETIALLEELTGQRTRVGRASA